MHIATLGLHEKKRIDFVVTRKGADKVVIVCSEDNEADADKICKSFIDRGIKCDYILVDPWKYEEILAKIIECVINHLKDGTYTRVEFNGSGGTRVMTAAAYMAALILGEPIYLVGQSEGNDTEEIITLRPVPIAMLSEPKKRIMESLKEKGGQVSSQKELGSRTDLGADSISKHIRELSLAKYVRTHWHGRRKSVELTHLGEMVLELKRVKELLKLKRPRIRAYNREGVYNASKTPQALE